jgi:predicted RNase H-like HicB family nuclease
MKNLIKVIIEPAEEGGYIAYCPALKGCLSQGETIEEVKENIKEAIESWFEARLILEIKHLIKKNQSAKVVKNGNTIRNIRFSPRLNLANA